MATAKLFNGQSNCACPTGDLPTMALQSCGDDIGQIVRFAVMKASGTQPFDGTVGFDITVQADWITALAVASSDSVLRLSPIFAGTTIEGGEAQIQGENDNSTPGGSGRKTNHTNSVLAGTFLSLTVDNAQALAEILNCNEALMFLLVNSEGRTFYVAPTSPAVNTDMIGSTLTWMNGVNSGGLNTVTTYAFSIKFKMENLLYIEGVDLSSFILDIDNP